MGWIEEWAGSEWSNQPGGAWKIIGREARWHQQPPACCSTKISKTQKFGYRCSLSKSKIATTPKLSLVCPPSPFYIQTWRARLFPSQNSPINFFCNFIFFLISGRGQLWREVVRKENEVSGHPPLPFPRILIPSPLFQNPTAGDHGGAGLQGVSDQNFDSSPKFWNVCKTFRARHPLSHFHWQVWEGKLGCKGGSCLGDFEMVVRKTQSKPW